MPGNILNMDTMFPSFRDNETSEQKLDKVTNYLYMLLEQLRYTLNNLDADNFNDTGLREIGDGIRASFEDDLAKTEAVIEAWAKETEAGFKAVAEWQGQTNESISSIDGKADANAASITLLNQWKGETSSSLAAIQVKASQNESQITALASWKNTAEDDIDGLSETMAVIEATADENGARINQIVSAIGEDGEVTFASIAAGIAEDESFIELIADKVTISADDIVLDADVYITGKDSSDNIAMKLFGNRIALNHPENASTSASGISFWYGGIDKELMATMKTTRDTTVSEEERYKMVIETLSRGDYPIVLKLISGGGMSMESKSSVYMEATTYCTLDAMYNTRIRANSYFSNAKSYPLSNDDYSFNYDGIYYGTKKIVDSSAAAGTTVAVFG